MSTDQIKVSIPLYGGVYPGEGEKEVGINEIIPDGEVHQDFWGNTPLIGIIQWWGRGNLSTEEALPWMEELLKHGANPNIANVHGGVPLNMATSIKAIKLLLKYGADISKLDPDNVLSLIAGNKADILEVLVKNGARLNMVGNYGTDIGFWPEDAIALAGDMVAEFAGREYYYGCGLRGTPLEFAKLYLQLAIKHKDEDGVAVQKRIIEIIELSL